MASDLIYREDAKDFVRHAYHKGLNPVEYLDEVPAADVVAVVRCGECINWNGNDCITIYGLFAPKPNDYCARGERWNK